MDNILNTRKTGETDLRMDTQDTRMDNSDIRMTVADKHIDEIVLEMSHSMDGITESIDHLADTVQELTYRADNQWSWSQMKWNILWPATLINCALNLWMLLR